MPAFSALNLPVKPREHLCGQGKRAPLALFEIEGGQESAVMAQAALVPMPSAFRPLQPHNLKVVGSNPTPATTLLPCKNNNIARLAAGYLFAKHVTNRCLKKPLNPGHFQPLPGIPCNTDATYLQVDVPDSSGAWQGPRFTLRNRLQLNAFRCVLGAITKPSIAP